MITPEQMQEWKALIAEYQSLVARTISPSIIFPDSYAHWYAYAARVTAALPLLIAEVERLQSDAALGRMVREMPRGSVLEHRQEGFDPEWAFEDGDFIVPASGGWETERRYGNTPEEALKAAREGR